MNGKWLILVLAALLLFIGWKVWPNIQPSLQATQPSTTTEPGYDKAEIVFARQRVKVLIPTTPDLQAKGLGGRERLMDSEGMLWQYRDQVRPTFWMKDMLVPLDFIWLNGSIVAEITPNIAPPQPDDTLPLYQPQGLVDGVLEVPGGFAARHQVEVGDEVEISQE